METKIQDTKIQDTKIPIKTNPDLEMENIQQPKEINQEEPIQPENNQVNQQPENNEESQENNQQENNQQETTQPQQNNQQETAQETIQENQEESPETQDILTQIAEKEKAIRSKILNRQCRKKPIIATTAERTKEKYTEKVQMKTHLTDTEEAISTILRNHPNKTQVYLYFQPVIETAALSIGSITAENLEDCESPEEVTTTTDQKEIIETKYKYLENLTLKTYLTNLQREPTPKNRYLQILATAHLQLLESAELLQSTNPPIVHFNLTPDTILYDRINATPVITDFRIAFTKDALDDENNSAELFPVFNNPYWAPEINAIAYLIETKPETVTETNDPQINTTLTPFMNRQTKEVIEELKKTYTLWDIYAINQIILECIPTNTSSIPFIEKYRELCSQYPPTITTLKQSIETLFQSIPKIEYEQFLQQIQEEEEKQAEPADKPAGEPADEPAGEPASEPAAEEEKEKEAFAATPILLEKNASNEASIKS